MKRVRGPEGCPCQFDYDDTGRLWRITDEACRHRSRVTAGSLFTVPWPRRGSDERPHHET